MALPILVPGTVFGYYLEAVCADKIYRTRENLQYCHEYGIRLSGPKLGRPFKEVKKNSSLLREQKRIERNNERARVAVEGKQSYSLNKIGMKLRATSESAIMMAFLVMNLMVLLRRKAKALLMYLFNLIIELVWNTKFWNTWWQKVA